MQLQLENVRIGRPDLELPRCRSGNIGFGVDNPNKNFTSVFFYLQRAMLIKTREGLLRKINYTIYFSRAAAYPRPAFNAGRSFLRVESR